MNNYYDNLRQIDTSALKEIHILERKSMNFKFYVLIPVIILSVIIIIMAIGILINDYRVQNIVNYYQIVYLIIGIIIAVITIWVLVEQENTFDKATEILKLPYYWDYYK